MSDRGEGAGEGAPGESDPGGRLSAEAERLCDEARKGIRLADRRARLWAVIDVVLGFPAALLAAVSGAAGLATADARVPAALLALVSAGLSAGAGFLRSDDRRVAHKRARTAWAALEGEAVVVLADGRLDEEGLRRLFGLRQAALAAYEGDPA
ncbi:hypothetical protein [Streptomyces sp. NPDC092952]|uniref:hypothetical protein n=1 Tax=Streptomyces sp. NPDC092952 TaxID=3366018 RepID=UPI00382E15CA